MTDDVLQSLPLVVVLGGGESGVGAALLARKNRFRVFLSDSKELKPQYRAELEAAGIEYEEGQHTINRMRGACAVVKSPGIPETAAIVCELREMNLEIISEIEFAFRFTRAKKVCITGSNGKTTTTLLTYHLMKESGLNVELAGNVGISLARQVYEGKTPDWFVIELSSFQLDGMHQSKVDVGVVTNVTPDHLDRYDHSFEKYTSAKFHLVDLLGSDSCFIYNADDPTTIDWMNGKYRDSDRSRWYGATTHSKGKLYTSDQRMHIGNMCFDVDKLPLKGLHNIYNTMQALAAARQAGCTSDDKLAAALLTFKNAEHRLEPVATIDGVDYINDSKATNVDSAWYALECQTRPVVWIAGGTDKGNDYSTLHALAREKVKALVCLGVDNQKLVDSFGGVVPIIVETRSISDCVAQCRALASEGDVVLLSPCCASFDLFNSYIHRGNCFKECVLKMQNA